MTGELRYSEELPEGFRRMDPRQWRFLMRRLEAVRHVFPESAVVGGTALRIWCSLLDMDVPEETQHPDIDILSPRNRFVRTKVGPSTGAVEVYPSFGNSFDKPFFTSVDYNGRPLTLITPPHLLVMYASMLYDGPKRGLDCRKQAAYYQIAKDTVLPEELADYMSSVPHHYGFTIPELLQIADETVASVAP